MTGFAREAGQDGRRAWAWELKSVNGRGLDVKVRVPPGFDDLGEAARREVARVLARGQCQLTLTMTQDAGPARVKVNREVLASLVAALGSVERPPGIGPATLDGLLSVRGVIEVEESDVAGEAEVVRAGAATAIPRLAAALVAAREAEGAALAGILCDQLARMSDLVAAAAANPARQLDAVRERLTQAIAALVGASPALDPARLHTEAVLLATRADIREELDRLRAHLDAARILLESGGPVGRKLDFLAQEFAREANTLCAKANDVGLSRTGLDLKAVVEQFREQVQNVE